VQASSKLNFVNSQPTSKSSFNSDQACGIASICSLPNQFDNFAGDVHQSEKSNGTLFRSDYKTRA